MFFFFFVPPTKKKNQKEKSSSQKTIRAMLTLKLPPTPLLRRTGQQARAALLVAGGLV
jgi:hypothetical protein